MLRSCVKIAPIVSERVAQVNPSPPPRSYDSACLRQESGPAR